MLDLGEAVIKRLLAAAPVTAIAGQRVHWMQRDQGGALPAVVLRQVSAVPTRHLKGRDDAVPSRVQADCLGRTAIEARRLAAAVAGAVEPVADVPVTGGTMKFWRGSFDGPRDLPVDEEMTGVFRSSVDLFLQHTI